MTKDMVLERDREFGATVAAKNPWVIPYLPTRFADDPTVLLAANKAVSDAIAALATV